MWRYLHVFRFFPHFFCSTGTRLMLSRYPPFAISHGSSILFRSAYFFYLRSRSFYKLISVVSCFFLSLNQHRNSFHMLSDIVIRILKFSWNAPLSFVCLWNNVIRICQVQSAYLQGIPIFEILLNWNKKLDVLPSVDWLIYKISNPHGMNNSRFGTGLFKYTTILKLRDWIFHSPHIVDSKAKAQMLCLSYKSIHMSQFSSNYLWVFSGSPHSKWLCVCTTNWSFFIAFFNQSKPNKPWIHLVLISDSIAILNNLPKNK